MIPDVLRFGLALAVNALCYLALMGVTSVAAPPAGKDWREIFTEEFTASHVDWDKWTDCYWWDRDGCTNLSNEELQWYKPANISLSDGMLRLTARPQPIKGHEGRIFPYTSGMVTSGRYYEERPQPDRFSMLYGYVEVRAKPPSGQGLWSAIWLLPSDHESEPEIDVMEVLGHQPQVLEMHFHCGYGDCAGRSYGHEEVLADLTTDFRVYGLEWSPEAIVWYLDGVEQWRFADRAAIPAEPMYLLMNLAVGGNWPGDPDESTEFPAHFLIDYVRVWQIKEP
jgi:beta-glucanase (GH16 family)